VSRPRNSRRGADEFQRVILFHARKSIEREPIHFASSAEDKIALSEAFPD
jgi:hypothetical protein